MTMDKIQITSAQYVLDTLGINNSCIKATIDGVEMSIPLDHANRHYAEILRQLESGQLTIQPASTEAP
jgi:hypothetical protein